MKWYFQNSNGSKAVTVEADNEIEAREKAMTAMYGPAPYTIGTPPIKIDKHVGYGLTLLSNPR